MKLTKMVIMLTRRVQNNKVDCLWKTVCKVLNVLQFVVLYAVCPSNCESGICDQSSGACSCSDGYYGADCNYSK